MAKQGKEVKSFVDSLKSLESKRRELEKQAAKLKANCFHKGKSGKLKVNELKGSKVICDKCGEVFDVAVIPEEKLKESVEIVHNALQQVRCMARQDKESDVELCQIYGDIDYNIKNLPVVYAKIVNKMGNGKKKHKKQNNDYGYYGKNVSFLGGRK